MISLYCWSSGQKAGMWLNPELLRTHADQLRASPDVYWINLENPTPEEEALVLEEFFPVHRLSFRDITLQRREGTEVPHFPKVEEFPDYLFVVINPLGQRLLDRIKGKKADPTEKRGASLTQLSVVLTRRILITHHYEPLAAIAELRTFIEKHEEQSARGPDYLFHIVLDALVDEFAPLLDRLQDILDRMETKVFQSPGQAMLLRLLKMKRQITLLRKTLIYEREITARLARGEFSLIDEREMVYYRNVYDHVVRFTELIESARETASDLMQTHLSAASNKLNEVMKALTMISTTVLPMTLISGIYGMNFDPGVWPASTKDYLGFLGAVGLMLASGLGSFAFFKWKGWI
ncbi:MAG: magnesium transporter CorA family protein [Gemmataceae bacterium]|nr:magnesium transporter CorA family protein [Gemmataceae bacterium]